MKLGLVGDLAERTGIKYVAGKLYLRPCSCHRAGGGGGSHAYALGRAEHSTHEEVTASGTVSRLVYLMTSFLSLPSQAPSGQTGCM